MPNTGAQFVRTAFGTGWSNPSGIEGTSSPAFRGVSPHSTTPVLIGTNALLGVPAGATINGIIVTATAQADNVSELGFADIQLVLGGAAIGTAKNPGSSDWLDVPKVFTYGSATDLWGTALTATNVNDPTFGFQAAVSNFTPNNEDALVSAYTVTVYYTFGGGGGGGIPGQSNGGMSNPLNMLLIPGNVGFNFSFYTLDPTSFNDPNSGSFYNWKVEDVIAGRTPTVNRVILSYRDLGVATITVTLSGVIGTIDALQPNSPKSVTTPIQIGTTAATGKICSVVLGMNFTAANLQLSVQRAANAGPVSITKARLEGRVETTVY